MVFRKNKSLTNDLISSITLLSRYTMVNRRISDDLKMAALRLKARGRDPIEEILQIVGFSRRTFERARHRYHHTGTVTKAEAIGCG